MLHGAQRILRLANAPRCLIGVFAGHAVGNQGSKATSCEHSGQTERMRRLIWVFARCTFNLVGHAVPRLSYMSVADLGATKWKTILILSYKCMHPGHIRTVQVQISLRGQLAKSLHTVDYNDVLLTFPPRWSNSACGKLTIVLSFFPRRHNENEPIEIYWKFYHQTMKIFR